MKKILILSGIILFISCNKQEEGIDVSSLHFTIESPFGTHYITDYEIPFTAKDANGNDITPSVKFYIDGNEIQDNTYIFQQPGNHTVTARWDLGGGTFKEADNQIDASVITPRHDTYVLIEDFTGTWCVNCPRVQYKIEQLLQQNNRVYAVAIHDKANDHDPFHFDQVGELTTEYDIYGYPTPLINREEVWDEETASVNEYLNRIKPLGLKIENTFNGTTLDITVKVRFDMDLQRENYKLVVFALENNLHADQANATNYYGGQNPIPNMEHDHVLRHAFTSVLGDPIPSNECGFDNEYVWTYSGSMPSVIDDVNNVEFMAFVVKGDEKPVVVNIKKTELNDASDY
jgi:thiol-disulfide isomerase/thioredoxin